MAKDFLYCEETDTKIYNNDVVTISTYPDVKWIAKKGWYMVGTTQKNGWYFVSIIDKTIVPVEQINLQDISKDVVQGTSELRPTLQDMDTKPPEVNYIVIPGTDIRIYDGDIVEISNKGDTKWIVHSGWYIYQDAQHFGWYFVSIIDGAVLPVSAVDLTLVTLAVVKTQGSNRYDGKVVNYTIPFTEYDYETLGRTFITLDNLEQRDNLDPNRLMNGKMVRVNDVGGAPAYYVWDSDKREWVIFEDFSGGIVQVEGDQFHPVILSKLESGLYGVKGTYIVSPNYDVAVTTDVDHIVIVERGNPTNIKVMTETDITDYQVSDDSVVLISPYASVIYVDTKISEIISELQGYVKRSIDLGATFNPGQIAIFDNAQAIKGMDATAGNIGYVPPQAGPTSNVSNVQNALDILNDAIANSILYGTEEHWNSQPQLIAAQGTIYIYSNHDTDGQNFIPGIKVGDGTSYLIDMPFIDKKYAEHITNALIHVSAEDRTFWDNKITCALDSISATTLILTKDNI